MKGFLSVSLIVTCLAVPALSQSSAGSKPANKPEPAAAKIEDAPLIMAKAVLEAHGGEKLQQLRSLITKGSLDLNVFNQSTPATFSMAISGDKYLFEINSPFQPLKQIYDGKQTYSSIQGFMLPPITSVGFPLLTKIGNKDYPIAALTDTKKKRNGFRITSPDGFYTDFLVDEKTNRIKGYESSYEIGGRVVTTSVEVDDFQTVDGIVIPKKYSQRFDLGQMTAYASFKAKEVLVNSVIEDDAFSIPK